MHDFLVVSDLRGWRTTFAHGSSFLHFLCFVNRSRLKFGEIFEKKSRKEVCERTVSARLSSSVAKRKYFVVFFFFCFSLLRFLEIQLEEIGRLPWDLGSSRVKLNFIFRRFRENFFQNTSSSVFWIKIENENCQKS